MLAAAALLTACGESSKLPHQADVGPRPTLSAPRPSLLPTVHIAPADYHVLIEPGYLSLTIEEPVRFSRPSIDVMFTSAADTYGSGAIGVVLTGANEDGAGGLARIVRAGGRGLIQDPKTAEIPIMPAAAMRAVPTAEVVPLDKLAPRLIQLSEEKPRVGRRTAV